MNEWIKFLFFPFNFFADIVNTLVFAFCLCMEIRWLCLLCNIHLICLCNVCCVCCVCCVVFVVYVVFAVFAFCLEHNIHWFNVLQHPNLLIQNTFVFQHWFGAPKLKTYLLCLPTAWNTDLFSKHWFISAMICFKNAPALSQYYCCISYCCIQCRCTQFIIVTEFFTVTKFAALNWQ